MQLKWPGFNKKRSLIIELDPVSFCLAENKIDVFGETFTAKKELHITVTGSKLGLVLQGKIKQDHSISKVLKKTFEEIDWSFRQTGPLHMLSRSADKLAEKSIILLLEMPALAIFYEQLKRLGLIDFKTPVPPAHITMYTQNSALGIGVSSEEALKTLSVKILPLNTLHKLCE